MTTTKTKEHKMDYRLSKAMDLLSRYIADTDHLHSKPVFDLNLDQMRDVAIASAMHRYKGNKTKVAEHLGIARATIIKHCQRLGL